MLDYLRNNYIRNNKAYRILLYLISIVLLLVLIPKKQVFKYEFSQKEVWKHEKLYADFDFAIEKTDSELEKNKQSLEDNKLYYFTIQTAVYPEIINNLNAFFKNYAIDKSLQKKLQHYLISAYERGVIPVKNTLLEEENPVIVLQYTNTNKLKNAMYADLMTLAELKVGFLQQLPENIRATAEQDVLKLLQNNISYNKDLTDKNFEESIKSLSPNQGLVRKGTEIIDKGQIVNTERYMLLQSYKKEYERQIWNTKKQFLLILGYAITLSLLLSLLFLYIRYFRRKIYYNNTEFTFLVFNILTVTLTVFLVETYAPTYLYFIPFCIQPIIIRSFFDETIAMITFLVTILIAALAVPNSFNFVIIQLIAGFITILTNRKLYRRVNLYVAVFKIILAYWLVYMMSLLIESGTMHAIEAVLKPMGILLVSGVLVFLAFPLIYFFERIFGLMSDLSLLELSDSNHPVLRLLANKAPGTLQHSFQVANLAEEAALAVGADTLLVKIGALYHDIGKIFNPMYFTENQQNTLNPHDDILPTESAKIIINHILDGVDLAKKYRIPDRIIDFIRTHHGDSVVYYFYKKQQQLFPDETPDIKAFKYNGAKPFSKETAILMICDSIEAASHSLKEHTSANLTELINKIVDRQLDTGQFDLAEISLKEINWVKKVVLKRLLNIYHVRVEYPE